MAIERVAATAQNSLHLELYWPPTDPRLALATPALPQQRLHATQYP